MPAAHPTQASVSCGSKHTGHTVGQGPTMSVLSLRLSASFLRHSHQAHHVHISRAFVSSGAARRSLSFTHTHTRNYVSSGTGLDVRSPRMGPLCARHTHTVAICVNALQHSATTATQPMPRGGCLPGATTCVTMQTSLPLGVLSVENKVPACKAIEFLLGKKNHILLHIS